MDKFEMNQVAFRYTVQQAAEDNYTYKTERWPEEVRQLIELWGGVEKIEADMVTAIRIMKTLNTEQLNEYINAIGPSFLRFRFVEELISRESKGA